MHFATNLYYLRRQRSLSQTELGEQVGVDYATIGRYERGVATPKLEVITKLAALFGVSIEQLRATDLTKGEAAVARKAPVPAAARGLLASPARHKVTVAVELDGTAEGLRRTFVRLTAFNETVAATE